MQDISLSVTAESGKRHGAVKLRGNGSRWLSAVTLDRRLFILGRYVRAVLTASLSPVAPIQLIENEVAPVRIDRLCQRGPSSFRLAVKPGLSLDPAHTGKILGLPPNPQMVPGEKRKRSYVLNLH